MWLEHWRWPKARQVDAAGVAAIVADVVSEREIPITPVVIKDDDDQVEGALVEMVGDYTHIYIGSGELRMQMVTLRDGEGRNGYIGFAVEDHPGAWEPAYLLFAAIAKALGGEIEDMITEDWEPERMHDELCDVVDVATPALLDDPDATTATVVGEAPLDAFDCAVTTDANGVVVDITGAGQRIAVRLACEPGELERKEVAKLGPSVRDELESVVMEHAFCRRANAAPAHDPQRAGKFVLEILHGAQVIDAVVVTSLDDLRGHAGKQTVAITQYFASGAPFWQAALRADHDLADLEALDELHEHRTWQWTP